ncbi:membrane protein insertase YidC [Virgibacillus salexigens]|uniref:Membrane protein insertase YidC n=1 Tax=Virgibacillus kapii TaxID=1638645 RepID=A0ABQ2DGM8_9BACI|nr:MULTISPECIES: membrane protein insertase YidC [Virgibacillus]MYL43917.1 membrane protein insertase YidC [Virgibacillus massiliensis]GGJ57392.1 membrane protein insertase YidC [Virgibacillus kapii]
MYLSDVILFVFQQSPPSLDAYGFWETIFVYPFSFLIYLSTLLSGNVGIGIIVITLFVRLALLPLIIKQQKTLGVFKEWRKEKQKINERYKKLRDTNNKIQYENEVKEINDLSKDYEFKPFKYGCMPFIIQIILIISLFRSIRKENEFSEQTFFLFTLGEPDKYFILPLFVGILAYIQFKFTSPNFVILRYIMALLLILLCSFLPSALNLYFLTTYIFLIFQHVFVNKYVLNTQNKLT